MKSWTQKKYLEGSGFCCVARLGTRTFPFEIYSSLTLRKIQSVSGFVKPRSNLELSSKRARSRPRSVQHYFYGWAHSRISINIRYKNEQNRQGRANSLYVVLLTRLLSPWQGNIFECKVPKVRAPGLWEGGTWPPWQYWVGRGLCNMVVHWGRGSVLWRKWPLGGVVWRAQANAFEVFCLRSVCPLAPRLW